MHNACQLRHRTDPMLPHLLERGKNPPTKKQRRRHSITSLLIDLAPPF
jgi:hypothetical protein